MAGQPPLMYAPGDFKAVREDLFKQALSALGGSFPVENETYSLSLEDLAYEGGAPPAYTKREQKEAVQHNRSLTARIKGRWALTDKATGKVVSRSSMRSVMDVPYLTERGTFIRNGTETTLPIQMRLVPGVYARMAEDGEARAQINVQPGTGRPMRVALNPAKPVFRLEVGTRNYKLYPLLKHMGVGDDELKAAWGDDVFKANQDDFLKGGGWYSGGKGAPEDGEGNPYDAIAAEVLGGKIDPVNARMTFGEAKDTVDPALLRMATQRLLAVARGDIEPDNRDSLENQRFVMAPDMVAERIRKDAGGAARDILWKATRDGNVDRIPAGTLSRYIHSLFTESGLAQSIEETNLLDAYQRATKLTRMGEGGISSVDSAPLSARMVHNTYKGFVDPAAAAESLRVGLDTQVAVGARKGADGLLYTPLVNARTGKREMVSSLVASAVPVAFPEDRGSTDATIPAMVGNDIEYLPPSEVKYFLPSGEDLFTLSSNLIPMKSGIKAGRLLMAQKHQTQAMSLVDRMAPYVQTIDPGDGKATVEERYGDVMGAERSSVDGVVTRVDDDSVTVRSADGAEHTHSLYRNFPLNRRSLVTNDPVVRPGDRVKAGQLLASSNYTDKDGVAAMGTQLRSAWLAYKGHNYLDGIVISDAAARKLTSNYLYEHVKDKEDGVVMGREAYAGAFPSRFTREQLATIDDNGAARPGTVLRKGDPVLLAVSRRTPGPQTLYRSLARDGAVTWGNDFEGRVIDSVATRDGLKVYTEAAVPAMVGDKLSNRYAAKGTIALILPEDKMPRDAQGRPLEILFSPTGVVSRVNSEQLVEASLGKVAEKTGKRYRMPGFLKDQEWQDYALDELAKAGLTGKEAVTDPDTGHTIPGIHVGSSYIIKFHHTSESKEGSRSTGGYSSDELPAGAGYDSPKTLGGLLLGAFVAHDSSDILKDMKLVKGQRNDEFWRDFRSGRTPRTPRTPLVYEKFLAHLEGAGVKVSRDGDATNIFAMTNKDVHDMAKGRVTTAATFEGGAYTPVKGGLFDPAVFGVNGDRWGRIDLPEPILNPVMEDVARSILGVTEARLRDVMAGRASLPDGSTGPSGLKASLAKINPKVAAAAALATVRNGTKSKRDKAVKQLRFLTAMDRHGVTPDDFMLDSVPVLPPRFRRITEAGGMTMVPDANYLYKAMMDTLGDLDEAKAAGMPDDIVGDGRLSLYDSFKAVTGLGEPTVRALQEKEVGGLLKWVFGKGSPKLGGFQRTVVGGKTDVTGRAVIDTDPTLRLDEIGLPEGQAWGLYRDFTIRKLAQAGMDVLQATRQVAGRSPRARAAMLEVMAERPLLMTRAPALHKFNVMAFRPRITDGHAVMLNPVVYGPVNGDNDGDAITYYVPVSKDATKKAYEKMLPSRNLLSARDFTAHYLPQEEYILGAYLATRKGRGPVRRVFRTEAEAIQAYRDGTIGLNDNVQITGGQAVTTEKRT